MLRNSLLACLLVVAGCGEPQAKRRTFVFEGPTMGTVYQVKVVREALPEARRKQLEETIRGELDTVNGLMSTYLDDSELTRFNRHSETAPFAVSEATGRVFQAAQEVSRVSGGALDVTIGPLVNAWGFGPGSDVPDRPPPEMSDEEIAVLRGRIGFEKLELSEEPWAIRKAQGDLYCDLSALAKGYAVDRMTEALAALGETDVMAEIGGEVRALGANDRGQAWRIGIERPQFTRGAVQRIVPLDSAALATSGDYRNYREFDGERVSHIMDPRTGRPIRHRLASVSVVHETCMMADAWSTALMVMGLDEGHELAEREGLAALFLVREGDGFREVATPAFDELAGESLESSR